MKNRFVLSTLSAAHALAVKTLKEADRAFYRQRQNLPASGHLARHPLALSVSPRHPAAIEERVLQNHRKSNHPHP